MVMADGWWEVVVPVVSALGGVALGGWFSGRNMINAERERAEQAEKTEAHRARNEIAAEDRRHATALRLATLERNLDAVRGLYVDLETARRKLAVAETDLTKAMRAREASGDAGVFENARQEYAARTAEFGIARDRASLDASDAVKDYADLLYFSALAVSRDSGLLPVQELTEISSGVMSLERRRESETQRASDLLSNVMRRELRAENG